MKINTLLVLIVATLLLVMPATAQEMEGQDASVDVISITDFNGMELHFSIEGITDVNGPYEIQFNTYSESGEKVEIATKYYDGASWNYIPEGSKRFDWIEVDPVKLHAGYNIITIKIVFGPLNAIPEINPSNNMDSMVFYYIPEPCLPRKIFCSAIEKLGFPDIPRCTKCHLPY